MSQELLKGLERYRELAAAGEVVDAFLGTQLDPRVRRNLARLSADGYKAEGKSLAKSNGEGQIQGGADGLGIARRATGCCANCWWAVPTTSSDRSGRTVICDDSGRSCVSARLASEGLTDIASNR